MNDRPDDENDVQKTKIVQENPPPEYKRIAVDVCSFMQKVKPNYWLIADLMHTKFNANG